MVAETGYIWSTQNFDALGNIVRDPDPQYLPVIPEKQIEYMTDYTRAVMRAGGIGVVFWEPAWVTTPCRTPWGIGTSHDHLVFFDPVNTNFMENGGGRWCESWHYSNPDDPKITFKLDMNGQDVSKGVYIAGSWSGEDPDILPMADEGGGIYSYYAYLPAGDTLQFFFLNDTVWTAVEPVPAECMYRPDGSRSIVVGQNNRLLSYAWGSCDPGGPPSEVDVSFSVSMKGSGMSLSRGVYIVGDINEWGFTPLSPQGDSLYSVTIKDVLVGSSTAYYFITNNTWDNYMDYRETVPEECDYSVEITGDPSWTGDRAMIVPPADTSIGYVWGSCTILDTSTGFDRIDSPSNETLLIYPNPASHEINLEMPDSPDIQSIEILSLSGRRIMHERPAPGQTRICMNVSTIPQGIYVLKIRPDTSSLITRKLLISR